MFQTFTARPRRARWPRVAAIAFVLATLVGGLVDGTVSARAVPAIPADVVPGRVVVRFEAGATLAERADAVRGVGAREIARVDPLDVHVLEVPEHAAARVVGALGGNPNVRYAELERVVAVDGEVIPDDPKWANQGQLRRIEAPAAWGLTRGSSAVRIAVLDTGVNPVSELDDKLLTGWNALDGSTDVTDTNGHGTLAAGVAGAETDNADAIASIGFDSSILPVKVLESSSGSMSDVVQGIVWAADHGADVISMSLSGPSGMSSLQDAVRYAASRDAVVVAAAGNNGDTVMRYPAAYPEVIGVAGTDPHDELYTWSNHGDWVDVSAPGINLSVYMDGSVSTYAGTSSATPVVAGLAALGASTGASAQQIRDAIQQGAVPLGFVRYGRIDAYAAVAALAGSGSGGSTDTNDVPRPAVDASCTDLSCLLDGSGSGDSDGQIIDFAWDLGDGATASGAQVDHTYDAAGSYTVTLTVTDDDGATARAQTVVDVTTPTSEPSPEPTSGTSPSDDTSSTSVTAVPGSTNDRGSWTAWVDVTVVVDGAPASGTTVTGVWDGDGKHGRNGTVTCTATSEGVCRLQVSQANNVPSVTFDISTVAGATTASSTKPE